MRCAFASFSVSPVDLCSGGVCAFRECSKCPSGVLCSGGDNFEPTVHGSTWSVEMYEGAGGSRSMLVRVVSVPRLLDDDSSYAGLHALLAVLLLFASCTCWALHANRSRDGCVPPSPSPHSVDLHGTV